MIQFFYRDSLVFLGLSKSKSTGYLKPNVGRVVNPSDVARGPGPFDRGKEYALRGWLFAFFPLLASSPTTITERNPRRSFLFFDEVFVHLSTHSAVVVGEDANNGKKRSTSCF
ncbi:hypothetical protein [Runella sp.]|uniref:hypothetical protein n=1 Tax=Runella sp. TaxID=1960881 RepID=UPI003019E275